MKVTLTLIERKLLYFTELEIILIDYCNE
jgi:hypothetical protein